MIDVIRNSHGERLDFAFHPGAADSKRVVVIGHGVTGHKDRPWLIALAEGLAAAGIPALRVSYSGNGASEGRFVDSNISKEVADLGAVFDALGDREIVYVGHSMGAAVGVLRASEDGRITRLVSLAGMVHVRAFFERHFQALQPDRDLMWEKPGCLLTTKFLEDVRRIGSTADRACRISVPWLLVHGDADTLVPLEDSRDAFVRARQPKQLVVFEGCDHIWEPGFTPRMVETVVGWLKATSPQRRSTIPPL